MPSNTVLTPSMILKEVYTILHQQSNFIMRTNRQYDDRFANRELKIGQTLDVRLPPKFVTRTGNTMSSQNLVERSVPLPLATINGIDLNLTQEELTFDIENERVQKILKAATSQLISTVEGNAMSTLYKKVPNYVGLVTTASTTVYRDFQNCGRYLTDNLAPAVDRTLCMDTQTRVDVADSNKNLFNPQGQLADTFTTGALGNAIGGFDVYENTLVPTHTSGIFTSAGGLTVTTSTTADTGFDGTGNAYPTAAAFDLKIDSDTSYALKAGDIITIAGVKDVHPETKQPYGYDKRFVVQADASGTTTGTVTILPFPILSGAYQNVSAALDNQAITLLGPASAGSAITYGQNIAFQRDAFAFVTADLIDPSQYGDWGARLVEDGLSIRIWRKGDIVNGNFPMRLDIAWGVEAIYPELATRWVHAQA